MAFRDLEDILRLSNLDTESNFAGPSFSLEDPLPFVDRTRLASFEGFVFVFEDPPSKPH